MYVKRPTRWRDVPVVAGRVILLVYKPWDAVNLAAASPEGGHHPTLRRLGLRLRAGVCGRYVTLCLDPAIIAGAGVWRPYGSCPAT
jgi:hypothetical protein